MFILKGKEKGVDSRFNGRRIAQLSTCRNDYHNADRLFSFVLGYAIKLKAGSTEQLSLVFGLNETMETQRDTCSALQRMIDKYNARKGTDDEMLSGDDETEVNITLDPQTQMITVSRNTSAKSGFRGWLTSLYISR